MTDQQFEELQGLLRHQHQVINYLQYRYLKETGQRFVPAFIGKLDDAEIEKIEAMLSGTDTHERRVGCDVYTPEDAPEVMIYYKATDPDIGPEIYDITVNGGRVSEIVYDVLLCNYGWEDEIGDYLADIAREAKEDKLIENFEIKQLESGIY